MTTQTQANDDRPDPTVGAIRWDAWTGGTVTAQVEKTLSPKRYQHRLPWFAEVIDDQTARIDGSPQSVMDREIEFAANAGLDYWAFLIYPQENEMSLALKQYLRSPERDQLGFCAIVHGTLNAEGEAWPRERDRLIDLLTQPGYVTVLDGRPLVYAFTGREFPFERFKEFLAAAHERGINPYCAFMGWNPAKDFERVSSQGFDAVSAYAKGGSEPEFSDLVRAVEKDYWQNAVEAKVDYIPMVTTGWDKNPRKDNPVSWEIGAAYHTQDVFPSMATPSEIADHLARARTFAQTHPDICRTNTIIIYAWNENDEGGWLSPTLGADGTPDTSRLDAIRTVLRE